MNTKTSILNPKIAEEELSLIRKIMEDSRRAVYQSSIQGSFWCILSALTLIINYLMFVTGSGLKYSGILWLGFSAVGTIGSIIIAKKEKKTIRVKTFGGKILTSIGISIGVSNIIMSFASVIAGAFNPVYIVPVDSAVLGLGFYVIGTILQMKFFKYLSFIWWAGAVVFLIFPSVHCVLFLALMLVVSVIIPKIEDRKKRVTAENQAMLIA